MSNRTARKAFFARVDGYKPVEFSPCSSEGRAYIYGGGAGGLGASAAWAAEGEQVSGNLGRAAGAAGDVNGDGYGDVIVGAFYYDAGQTDEGRAYVYHGSPDDLSASPAWTAESDQADAYLGYSVSAAGDVNGDGYGDVIVGAHWYDVVSGTAIVTGCTTVTVTVGSQALLLPGSQRRPAGLAALTPVRSSAPATQSGEPVTVTRVITYTYDPLNRLTSAAYSTGESFAYAYDTVGNRTAYTETTLAGTSVTTYIYDAANRLTSVNGVAYTWDQRGSEAAGAT